MSEHTKGPWSWGSGYRGLYGSGPNNEVLTHVYCEGMHLSYGAAQAANACLIAAAPALLEALERLMPFVECLCDEGPEGEGWPSDALVSARVNADAAIRSAKGKA
jgi:hypothetical protein